MVRIAKAIINKIRQWEYQNIVWGRGYVDKTKGYAKSLSSNMQTRGYDVMRISPRVTNKFGLKYRAVYGSQVVPNYNMQNYGPKKKKMYPKVEWYLQGYIKAGKKSGTVVLNRSIFGQFQRKPLESQLMVKKKR